MTGRPDKIQDSEELRKFSTQQDSQSLEESDDTLREIPTFKQDSEIKLVTPKQVNTIDQEIKELKQKQDAESLVQELSQKIQTIKRLRPNFDIRHEEIELQQIQKLANNKEYSRVLMYAPDLLARIEKFISIPKEENIQKNTEILREEINKKISTITELLQKRKEQFSKEQIEHIKNLLHQVHKYWKENNWNMAYDFADRAYNTTLSAERITREIRARAIELTQPPQTKKGLLSRVGSAVSSFFGFGKK